MEIGEITNTIKGYKVQFPNNIVMTLNSRNAAKRWSDYLIKQELKKVVI